MPSVDVIRNITIRGKADGVDDATAALNRLTDSIKSANDNLARSNAAAQDNNAGFRITGEGAATAANHLRQAAEAAYVFSPAFRGLVNEMKTPVLAAANTTLAAVATGIVTATNYAGSSLIALAGAAEKASPSLLAYTSGVRMAGIAMEGFNPTVSTAAGSLLSFLAPALRLVGWFTLAVKGIESVGEAWRLGGEKLAEYVALSEKATASGLSMDFFQRITKSATDAKLPIDELTAALKKLRDMTSDQLGGTSAQNHFRDLITAGNFGGNSSVGQLSNANTVEEKFRAIAGLIDQAMQKGERLAALDVAKTFLGDVVAGNLARDSDYLNKMLASADDIKATELVSQASIDNAVALQNRLDAAEKILSERWHPIQNMLTQLGIQMKTAWVEIVEAVANAVDWVAKLVEKLSAIPVGFWSWMQNGSIWKAMSAPYTDTPDKRKAIYDSYAISFDQKDIDQLAAKNHLADLMKNPANILASRDQTNAVQNAVFKDASFDLKKPDEPVTAAYNRATESLLKYIATTNAAADSVGKGVAEQEKAKAVAQLMAAAEKDGTTVTAELRSEMDRLAERASNAAQALEKAKIASEIKFNSQTSLLSQEDVQIANQLKGIYPNVAVALGSVEAHGIRVNNAMKGLSSTIENNLVTGLTDIVTGSKTAAQGFRDMTMSIVKDIEQMIVKLMIVEPLMKSLQGGFNSFGLGSAFSSGSSSFIGPVLPSAHGNLFSSGNVIAFAQGGVVNSPSIAPMALFGEAGPEAIVPLKRGADGNLGIASSSGGGIGDIHISSTVVVQGGSNSADATQADLIAKQAASQIRTMVQSELITQLRPGGVLNLRRAA